MALIFVVSFEMGRRKRLQHFKVRRILIGGARSGKRSDCVSGGDGGDGGDEEWSDELKKYITNTSERAKTMSGATS